MTSVALSFALMACATQVAEPGNPTAYALVVSSSAGGNGQGALEYSQGDAERLAAVLVQLGRYPKKNVELLIDPTRAKLQATLGATIARLKAHRARGEQSTLIFYYSGHARAQALSLGTEEFGLNELRDLLTEAPASLVVAILDACQSGAISHIKGVDAAAAFSTNSVNRLDTEGLAVLASSTANEMSQESASLKGSYFTHHLVAGLRGAADLDGDGRVTLSEAYRYAYGRTVVATAATAVGGQHPTLETNLKGKGEVALSFPSDASASLRLPAELEGDIVVASNASIVAELHKVAGSAMALGLPPGAYEVVVNHAQVAHSCVVDLVDHGAREFQLATCPVVSATTTANKGADLAPARWGLEMSGGFGFWHDDVFVSTWLNGYRFQTFNPARARVGVSFDLSSTFTLLLDGRYVESIEFRDDSGDSSFRASTFSAGPTLRANFRFWDKRFTLYAQVSGGLGWSPLTIKQQGQPTVSIINWGYTLGAAAGAQVMPFRHFGAFAQANFDSTPVVRNFNGIGGDAQPRDSGGFSILFGLRAQL